MPTRIPIRVVNLVEPDATRNLGSSFISHHLERRVRARDITSERPARISGAIVTRTRNFP